MSTSVSGLTRTHEQGKVMFTDGDWDLMKGPLSWFQDQERYYLHHTCTELGNNGEVFWKTWFDPKPPEGEAWCAKCPSEPPDEMRGLLLGMNNL